MLQPQLSRKLHICLLLLLKIQWERCNTEGSKLIYLQRHLYFKICFTVPSDPFLVHRIAADSTSCKAVQTQLSVLCQQPHSTAAQQSCLQLQYAPKTALGEWKVTFSRGKTIIRPYNKAESTIFSLFKETHTLTLQRDDAPWLIQKLLHFSAMWNQLGWIKRRQTHKNLWNPIQKDPLGKQAIVQYC